MFKLINWYRIIKEELECIMMKKMDRSVHSQDIKIKLCWYLKDIKWHVCKWMCNFSRPLRCITAKCYNMCICIGVVCCLHLWLSTIKAPLPNLH